MSVREKSYYYAGGIDITPVFECIKNVFINELKVIKIIKDPEIHDRRLFMTVNHLDENAITHLVWQGLAVCDIIDGDLGLQFIVPQSNIQRHNEYYK